MHVTHKIHGQGEVVGKRWNGYELEVQFENGKRLWVKSSQLVENKPAPATFVSSALLSPLNNQGITETRQVKARRIVEALRLGIASEDDIERLTFGRSDEINRISTWLNEPKIDKQPIFLIEGDYGVGKSHLLAYMRLQALKLNYAVASVQVDGTETPFHMPKRVYAALAKSFAYPKADGSTGDFRGFIIKYQNLIPTRSPHRPYFFSSVKDNLNDDNWWEWLMGKSGDRPSSNVSRSSNSLEALRSQQNTGNVYSYMLSFLGWLASKASLRGLLLIFDEAESFNFATQSQIQKGLSFIRTLTMCCHNNELMLMSPSSLGSEKLKNYGLDFGSRSGHIPPLYRDPSHLRMLMAFTDLSSIRRQIPLLEDMPAQIIKPLQGQQVAQSVDELSKIYAEAYNVELSENDKQGLIRSLEQEKDSYNIRHYIKQCIEYMDLVRHGWPEV